MNYCDQCGMDAIDFLEGVCADCCKENQRRLDDHNAQHDLWEKLSDSERDTIIRNSY